MLLFLSSCSCRRRLNCGCSRSSYTWQYHITLYLEYVLLYVLQVIILNQAMKIVSNLLVYQNNIFVMLRILEPCIYYKYSYNSFIH